MIRQLTFDCVGEGEFPFVASLCHTKVMNAGNKRSFSVAKIDDSISTHQKKQQDMGQYKGMIYSEKEAKMDKLSWLVLIFDNAKGGGVEGKECNSSATSLFCGTGHFS